MLFFLKLTLFPSIPCSYVLSTFFHHPMLPTVFLLIFFNRNIHLSAQLLSFKPLTWTIFKGQILQSDDIFSLMCCEQAWGIFFIFELLYALSLAQQKGKKELAFFTIPTWITDDLFHLHEARDLQQVQ